MQADPSEVRQTVFNTTIRRQKRQFILPVVALRYPQLLNPTESEGFQNEEEMSTLIGCDPVPLQRGCRAKPLGQPESEFKSNEDWRALNFAGRSRRIGTCHPSIVVASIN
jgi:hypothetical protein